MQLHEMAGHLIRRLNQHSTQVFSQHVQQIGYDLTPVQFAAMNAIASAPGIDQASIAAKIAYDKATIGGVIDRLEQKGYILRTVSQRDRRAREVSLTPEGQKLFDKMLPEVIALQRDILPGLNQDEYAQFIALAYKAIAKEGKSG